MMKSLDAIHISTAILWKQHEELPIIFLTHDEQQGKTARASGFEVFGNAICNIFFFHNSYHIKAKDYVFVYYIIIIQRLSGSSR